MGPTKPKDFKEGQRVHHIVCGLGRVTRIDEGDVHVSFDDPGAGVGGKGIYDAAWFKTFPTSLQPNTR